MTGKVPLLATDQVWDGILKMYEEFRKPKKRLQDQTASTLNGLRPPVRFITHVPYSTYTIRTYQADTYDALDLDGDDRAGQEYVVMVDGETPVEVSLFHYDPNGNHKQMVSFVGDNILGEIKLVLGNEASDIIELDNSLLTETYLIGKLEAITSIGKGNIKVSIWPGRWLIEFAGDLAGKTFDLLEVDIIDTAVYKVHVFETVWADSDVDTEVIYPIPLVGEYDSNDNVVNDAVAAGSFGTAQWFPNIGWVADVNECRDFNGDGTPNL